MIDILISCELKNTVRDEKTLQNLLSSRAGGKWNGMTPVWYYWPNIIYPNPKRGNL